MVCFRTAGAVDEEFDDSDDEDISVKRHIPLLRKNRRHIPYWYARKMQKFGKRGMVRLQGLFWPRIFVREKIPLGQKQ